MTNDVSGDTLLWWQRGVIYQIYPRSFQDTNGDGVGDLAGIIARLDYLSETLGVDAIWLSPFYPSPMADFGYDVADYVDVHPLFGDLPTFDRLVAEAHRRELKIIIDFVPNHSSDQHPWFLESRSSRDNPKRDWYVWRDPKPDGSPPNNWLAAFGGIAWEWDEATQQYYLHSFLKEQPDLNWRNPAVKQAMFDVVRFWLDRGVDGFRIDVAHLVMKDPDLRDNPPNPDYHPAPGQERPYESQLHVYDRAHPDVHEVYRDLHRLLDSYSLDRPRMMIGEIHEFSWPVWATYYGSSLDEFHLPFNFGLINIDWDACQVRAVVDGVEAATQGMAAWPNYVLGNHDEHRIATRAGSDQAGVAMMLLLTLRGTPTTYYGDEIAMHDVPIPPEMIQDPFEILSPELGQGRDPERTPMQWDAGPNAGFCPPDVRPWLPIATDYPEINVAVEEPNPHSMLTLTCSLLRLRRSEPALHGGRYRPIDDLPDDCFVYVREHADRTLLIALNFGPSVRTLHLDEPRQADVLLSTYFDRGGPADLSSFDLRPNEGCVLQREGRAE
jgi:alpha-glucosidase